MKKLIMTILLAIIISLLILSISACGFVSWVWGGNRFSPEAAMEAVSLGSSQRERIETVNCYSSQVSVSYILKVIFIGV